MHFFLLGLLVLLLFLVFSRYFIKADAKALVRLVRKAGAAVLFLVAFILAVTGKFAAAVPLAFLGWMLLTRSMPFGIPGGFGPGNANKREGQRSEVRTAYLQMVLDHDTGAMSGRVLKGRMKGRELSTLARDDLIRLFRECFENDPESAQLLEAYLDQAHTDWRDMSGGTGQYSHQQQGASPGRTPPMGVEEAYEVLGLKLGASKDDVHKAHRSLMKRFHPDQGGSTYLAAKINEAKDILFEALDGG